MTSSQIYVGKLKLLVSSSLMQEYFSITKSTFTGWKKKDNFPDSVEVDGEKALFYDFNEIIEWKHFGVKDKFSPKKDSFDEPDEYEDEDEYEEFNKIGSLKLSDLDLTNKVHINMVIKTVGGIEFLDGLKQSVEIQTKDHKFGVETKRYIIIGELDTLMSEFMSTIHTNIVAMREQLPLTQIENLIEKGIVDSSKKEAATLVLKEISDSYFENMYKHLTDTLFDEVGVDTMIEYFEIMKQNYEEEKDKEDE